MSRPSSLDIPDLEGFPRVRWSPRTHRLEYHSLSFAQPGELGFVGLREIKNSHSIGSLYLSPRERDELLEVDKLNSIADDLDLHLRLQDKIRKRSHRNKDMKKKYFESPASPSRGEMLHSRQRSKSLRSPLPRKCNTKKMSLKQP